MEERPEPDSAASQDGEPACDKEVPPTNEPTTGHQPMGEKGPAPDDEPAPDGTQCAEPPSPPDDQSVTPPGELPAIEEQVEEVPAAAVLAPLADGTELQAAGGDRYRVVRQREGGYGYNLYAGERIGAEDACQLWIWEEATPGERLGQEAAVLQATRLSSDPLFFKWRASFEHDGRVYMATDAGPEETLQDVIGPEMEFVRAVSILARVAAGLMHLNEHGLVHAAVRPSRILVDDRVVKLVGLDQTVPINERASTPRSYAGYSAPEVAAGESLDAQTDIYGLGAILYHVTVGTPIPEVGIELATGLPSGLPSGVPQILHRCLGPREQRFRSLRELHYELGKLLRRSRPLRAYEVAGASIIGLNPDRTTNEDAYGYLQGQMMDEEGVRNWGVFCLADGMGGMDAGEVASRISVQEVIARAAERLGTGTATEEEHRTWPAEWIQAANTAVCDAMDRRGAQGGTTIVVVVALDQTVTIGHVGDSRLYRIRGSKVELLTRDHSLVMTYVMQGEITEEEARRHPDRNTLTRSVGGQSLLPPYHIDTLESRTGEESLLVDPDDVLILCTDGVWELLEDVELAQEVSRAGESLPKLAQRLLDRVLELGAPDNATVLLVRSVAVAIAGTGYATLNEEEEGQ